MLLIFQIYLIRLSKKFIPILSAAVLGTLPAAAGPQASTLWFAPRSQLLLLPAPDFMTLFKPKAAWPKAASRVKIFKLYSQFVHNASDTDLRTVITSLQQRKIALAMEYGFLNRRNPALCGGKGPDCGLVEGFAGEFLAGDLARLKRLGADLRYVAMDEPLWFGNYKDIPGAPQAPVSAVAQDVATQVATLHQYYPNAQVGDIEPIKGDGGPADWADQIMQWADAYKAATGQPLAFFHTDVAWRGTGFSEQLSGLHAKFKAAGIPFGIIYNGNMDDAALQWMAAAEKAFAVIENNPANVPEHAILQSWHPQPLYALPETQPGTMTSLINRYAAAETVIKAATNSSGFAGTLTSNDMPVTGAKISAYAVDDGTLTITTTASVTNTVPAGATSAVAALRINTECSCNAAADVLIGTAQYRDLTFQTTVTAPIVPPNSRVVVPLGQSLLANSKMILVTPGNRFSFSVPMQVPYSSRNSGFVAIVFLNAAGAEIWRWVLPLTPGQRFIGSNVTTKSGQFTINAKPSSVTQLSFSGNPSYRVSSVTLSQNN